MDIERFKREAILAKNDLSSTLATIYENGINTYKTKYSTMISNTLSDDNLDNIVSLALQYNEIDNSDNTLLFKISFANYFSYYSSNVTIYQIYGIKVITPARNRITSGKSEDSFPLTGSRNAFKGSSEEFTKDIVIISESNNMKVEILNKKELIIGYSESKIIDILQDIITQRFEDYGARIAKLTFDTEYEWFDIHSTATPAITFTIKIINPLLYN